MSAARYALIDRYTVNSCLKKCPAPVSGSIPHWRSTSFLSPISFGKYHYKKCCQRPKAPQLYFDRIFDAPVRRKMNPLFPYLSAHDYGVPGSRLGTPCVMQGIPYAVVNVQMPPKRTVLCRTCQSEKCIRSPAPATAQTLMHFMRMANTVQI